MIFNLNTLYKMTKTSSTNKKATSPAKKATSRKIKPKVDKKDAAKKKSTYWCSSTWT